MACKPQVPHGIYALCLGIFKALLLKTRAAAVPASVAVFAEEEAFCGHDTQPPEVLWTPSVALFTGPVNGQGKKKRGSDGV